MNPSVSTEALDLSDGAVGAVPGTLKKFPESAGVFEVEADCCSDDWNWLDNEFCEVLDLSGGFANFDERLLADEDRESASLNRDFDARGGVLGVLVRPGRLYKPVSGSATGADWIRVCRGKFVDATKSFPESLSLSMTVKLIEYSCSCFITWKTIFSSKTGLRLWRITRVLIVFLPRDVTTKGSISKEVRVTAIYSLLVNNSSPSNR